METSGGVRSRDEIAIGELEDFVSVLTFHYRAPLDDWPQTAATVHQSRHTSGRENFETALAHIHIVLHSVASDARNVEAWLDRQDSAGWYLIMYIGMEQREFVESEPNAMTDLVREGVGWELSLKTLARSGI